MVGRSRGSLVHGFGRPHFQIGKAAPAMDRFIYRLITFLAIAFALAYVWTHYNLIAAEARAFVADWWH
jgi:hypothetical protein